MKPLTRSLYAMAVLVFGVAAMAGAGEQASAQDRVSNAERYAQSQVQRAVHKTNSSSTRLLGGAPARDGATIINSAPAASQIPDSSDVKVFRGGRADLAQPCGTRAAVYGVTVHAGCNSRNSSELAGGPRLRKEQMGSASLEVEAVRRGSCGLKIIESGVNAGDPRQVTVCYGDLEPVYGGRIDDLHERIEEAAKRACGITAGYGAGVRHKGCEDQAIDIAIYRSGLPALIAFHEKAIGRLPQVFVGSRRY